MSKGGSKPAGNTTSTTTNSPWSGIVPYLNTGLQAASDLYSQGGPQYYPGQTYAGETIGQSQGISDLQNIGSMFAPLLNSAQGAVTGAANNSNSLYGLSQDIGADAGNNPSNSFFANFASGNNSAPGLSTLNDYASGKYLSADNPYFQQMSDTLKANVLPGINAQFANAGRGNSGLAARAASEGLGDSIGNLAYQNYQQGLTQQQNAASSLAGYGMTGAQGLSSNFQNSIANRLSAGNLGLNASSLGLNAAALAPSLQNMGINAANASLLGGTTQQGLDQNAINDLMQRYNYNAQLPYQNLQNYIANITAQNAGGSSSSTTQPFFQNQTANMLGTGLGALGLYNGLGGLGSLGVSSLAASQAGIAGGVVGGSGILGGLSSLFPFLAL